MAPIAVDVPKARVKDLGQRVVEDEHAIHGNSNGRIVVDYRRVAKCKESRRCYL
jgi:hypothetical protein